MIIYDIDDNILLDAIVTDSAEHEQELSKSDFIKLSWECDIKITLPAGSYIIPFDDGLKYRLLNSYSPSETDKGFKYEPNFEHPLMWLKRVPFLYLENDLKQQEWSFEGLTVSALEYVCKAINTAFNITEESKQFTYTLCGTVDGSVSFSVSSNDILSVLSSIASACKENSCEWHLSFEHHCLYFGQISINLGEDVPLLRVHDNIQTASVSESKEDYYNCFYPQGSTKNMSRKAQVGTGNVATLARLGLDTAKYPDGCIYVGTDGKVITKAEFEESNAVKQTLAISFDDIFPHIDLYAYNIRKRVRYLKNDTTNEYELNPNGSKKTYSVWYMRLAYCTTIKDDTKILVNTTVDKDEQGNTVTHYWYDYELDKSKQVLQGYTLKGTFKVNTHTTDNQYDALSQSLVGQPSGHDGFELAYHETEVSYPAVEATGDSGISVRKGDYEIIMYKSGDAIIPTNEEDGLYPRGNSLPDLTCNIVVLFNIVMGEYETNLAQEELATRTIKEINRRAQDNNNYTSLSAPTVFEKSNPNLYIGQKVIFNDGFGYQFSTRVIKLVTKLDYPIIQEITVGNQAIKGTISQLKEDVNNILSGNFSGGGINSDQAFTIVKNYADARFLSKVTPDTARGLIRFLDGIAIGKEGGQWRLDANGFARLYSVMAESIRSGGFQSGLQGSGFALWDDAQDGSTLEVDNLLVRKKMTAAELEIKRHTYTAGPDVKGHAAGRIFAVTPLSADGSPITDQLFATPSGEAIAVSGNMATLLGVTAEWLSQNGVAAWKCYFTRTDGERSVENEWRIGDLARCQTINLVDGITTQAANRHYWRVVTDTGQETLQDNKLYNYATLSNLKWVAFGENARRQFGVFVTPEDEAVAVSDGSNALLGEEYQGTLGFARADEYDEQQAYNTGDVVILSSDAPAYAIAYKAVKPSTGQYPATDTDGEYWQPADFILDKGYDWPTENDVPASGDDLVQEGQYDFFVQSQGNRQGLIVIDPEEGVSVYRGINSFSFAGKLQDRLSPNDTVITANSITLQTTVDGETISAPIANYLGAWKPASYPYYAEVTHGGSTWICVSTNGASPTDEPSKDSTKWQEKVAKGDSLTRRYIVPSASAVAFDTAGNLKSPVTFTMYRQTGTAAPIIDTEAILTTQAYDEAGNAVNNPVPGGTLKAVMTVNSVAVDTITLPSVQDGTDGADATINVKGGVEDEASLPANAQDGDCYITNADGHLHRYEAGVWTDLGQIRGRDGADGADGKAAVQLWLSPQSTIVTQDIDTGAVDLSPARCAVLGTMGDRDISANVAITGLTSSPDTVTFESTTRQDGITEIRLSRWTNDAQEATATFMATYGSVSLPMTFRARFNLLGKFRQTIQADTSTAIADSERWVEGKVGELATKEELQTQIRQTSESISLQARRVDNIRVGGANMLPFTDFSDPTAVASLTRENPTVDTTVTMDGRASLNISTAGLADYLYKGLYYVAKVEPGKEYVFSAWVYTDDVSSFDSAAYMEVWKKDAAHNRAGYMADGLADGATQSSGLLNITPTQGGKWVRHWYAFTPPAGVTEIECNVMNARNGRLWVSSPMLQAGNTPTAWSPCPEDYATKAEVNVKANEINLSVTDLKTGLEQAGVHVNGENSTITLKGDHVIVEENAVLEANNATINNLNVTNANVSGKVTAGSGQIAQFDISYDGLVTGDPSKWTDPQDARDFMYVNTSSLRLTQQESYNGNPFALIKVGIGKGSDPTNDTGYECSSAMYVYRKMLNTFPSEFYTPAIKIESHNVVNRNVAARFVGAVQVHGGLIATGNVMNYAKSGDTTVIDISFGTTVQINNTGAYTRIFVPSISDVIAQAGIKDRQQSFCIPMTVFLSKSSKIIRLSTEELSDKHTARSDAGWFADTNGGFYRHPKDSENSILLDAGDYVDLIICNSPENGYYFQIKQISV